MSIPLSSDRSSSIYRALHRAVVEQRLPPGTKLSEDQLGHLFGASRTLVRSALQALTRDGLVVSARNRGAFVASPTVRDAREIFESRRLVEAITAERAARALSPDSRSELAGLLDSGARAVAGGERGAAIRLSGEFHLAIARMADQRVLYGFLADLMSRSSLVIALYGHSNHSTCGSSEHEALLAALEHGDGAEARRLMLQHLDHIEADLDFARHEEAHRSLAEIFGSPVPVLPEGVADEA